MELDFEKENGLIPAIVQDHTNGEVLMLGFMNAEALALTKKTGFVTFYSRSRKKLWTKGESSGQKLLLRMGPANEAIMKAKLRELRKAVVNRPDEPVTH